MKKLFLAAIALVTVGSVNAQVKIEESMPLSEAVVKAKAEGKKIIAMGSTTWCGPCKGVIMNILPSKELGDYMNDKIIFIHYDLDVNDVEDFSKKHKINAYPTFVAFNAEGKEISRHVGGTNKVEEFKAMIDKITDASNSMDIHTAKYKEDPMGYGMKYVTALSESNFDDQATEVFNKLFAERSVEENFNAESIKYYNRYFYDADNVAFDYMLHNPKEVAKVMGKKEMTEYIAKIVNDGLGGSFFKAQTADDFIKLTDTYKDYKIAHTDLYKFIRANAEYIVSKDLVKLHSNALKILKNSDNASFKEIILLAYRVGFRMNSPEEKEIQINFFNKASSLAQNEETRAYATTFASYIPTRSL